MSWTIVGVFFGTAAIGIPIAFALGLAALAGLVVGDMAFNIMAEKMMFSVDSFPLMAIPFFMLAGELMVQGGIMTRLIDLANSLVGRVRGGLAQVAVGSGMGMACVSGTAVADATALGALLIRPMQPHYGLPFSTAVVAAAANLGPILPPSTAMIIYATLAGSSVSVSAMFAAGFVPGLTIGFASMALIWFIARARGFPVTGERVSLGRVLHQLRRAGVVLMMPVVVIGGIVGGVFTATEGGAIAVAYAILAGLFVTRDLKLSDLPQAMLRAAITTSVVGALVAFASTVTFIFTIELVPMRLAEYLSHVSADPTVFLLLTMAVLVVVGMFIEPTAAYIMLVPIFAPLAIQMGVDPLHFAMCFVLNLVVGVLTPPVGTLLFVMCGMTGLTMWQLFRELWPFVVVQYGVVLITVFWPDFVLWLPRALGN